MQNGIFHQAQDFLSKAADLGLIDEINERIEERNTERRAQLIAKLKSLPTEADAGLVQLTKAATRAAERLEKARLELSAAQEAYNSANMQSYGAHGKFHARRTELEEEIKSYAPQFIRDAHRDLDDLFQHVRHLVAVSTSYHWTIMGRQAKEETNAEQVGAVMSDIRQAQQQLEAVVLDVTDIVKAREEVELICQGLQQRCVALGLDEKEFNARHARRDHAERAEASRQKRSAARSQILQTLDV